MQPYLGVSAFSSTVEKSVSERIHCSSGAIRLLFPGPIRSFPSHRRQISARHERERKGEGGGEGGIVEESRTWSTANCSPIRFHGYTGRGAETICLAGRTPFPRQENRLPVFLLLLGLFQACFPYG